MQEARRRFMQARALRTPGTVSYTSYIYICIHISLLTPPKIYISVVVVTRNVRQRQKEYTQDCCETERTKNKETKKKQNNQKPRVWLVCFGVLVFWRSVCSCVFFDFVCACVFLVRLVSFGSGCLFVGIRNLGFFSETVNLRKLRKMKDILGNRTCGSPAWKSLTPNSSEGNSCRGLHINT